jgi:SAM-dependent methyltransferase
LADASFDAVLPHTLFSHVYDAAAVIREAARIVRPGGVVVVFDGDYGSLTVGTDDPAEGGKDGCGHHRKRMCQSAGDARNAKALAEIRAAA